MQSLHGCGLSVAPALAPAWAPNLGLGCWWWVTPVVPQPNPGLGPGASRWWVAASAAPQEGTHPKRDQMALKRPQMVPDGIQGASSLVHGALWPTGRAWSPFGALQNLATHLLLPVWPHSGPLWAQLRAHSLGITKRAVSRVGQPETRFRGHFFRVHSAHF